MKETVGLIGAGLLGSELGRRLLAGGYGLLVNDLDPVRARSLGAPAATAPEVAGRCRRIVLCLPESSVVRDVVRTLPLRRGQVLVDATTGTPRDARSMATRLGRKSVRYLDATIAGSSAQVRRGDGLILAGGPRPVFSACRDLLGAMARRVVWVGASGSGSRMKLVHNLVLGLNRAALAEGLAFARMLGLNPARTLEVLGDSPAASAVMAMKGRRMVEREFAPEARLAQHLKDVRLMLAEAARSGLTLPFTTAHRRVLERAVGSGWGSLDNSAIIKTYDP